MRKMLSDVDSLLRGDPKKETDGLVARLHKQENEVNLLKAVLLRDQAGNKGLVGRVEALEGGREDRRGLWKNVTSIIVAAIMSGLVTHFWGDIRGLVVKKEPSEQVTDHPKKTKPHRRHVDLPEDD